MDSNHSLPPAASDNSSSSRSRWLKFGICGVAMIGVVGVLSTGSFGGEEAATNAAPRVLPVHAMKVDLRESFQIESRFLGRVEAARSSELGFELAGTVMRIAVEEGDRVEAGDLLAELDTARLATQRAELKAALKEAQAGEHLAKLNHERIAKVAGSAVSEQSLDQARQEMDATRAAVEHTRARLESINVSFAKSRLVSPYAGVISKRLVDEGQVLSPELPVFRLLEAAELEIRVGLSPSAARDLKLDQEMRLTDADGREFRAKLARLLPDRGDTTRTVNAILSPKPTSPTLRDGDLVEVIVPREVHEAGFWLPRSALTESVRGLWATYGLTDCEETGACTIERRQLEILHQSGEQLFVRGALQDGDRIVANGLHRLVPRQRVTPILRVETAQK